jgi:hypothetical protein
MYTTHIAKHMYATHANVTHSTSESVLMARTVFSPRDDFPIESILFKFTVFPSECP